MITFVNDKDAINSLLERKSSGDYVRFIDVSENESPLFSSQVKQVIVEFIRYLNVREMDALRRLSASDAIFDSRAARGKVGIARFHQAMQQSYLKDVSIFFDQVVLSVFGEETVRAQGFLKVLGTSGRMDIDELSVYLVSRNGKYLISKTNYL